MAKTTKASKSAKKSSKTTKKATKKATTKKSVKAAKKPVKPTKKAVKSAKKPKKSAKVAKKAVKKPKKAVKSAVKKQSVKKQPKKTVKKATSKKQVARAKTVKKPVAKKAVVKKPSAKKPSAKKQSIKRASTKKQTTQKPQATQTSESSKTKTVQRHGFRTGEYIIYPARGVGQIMEYLEQEIAGYSLQMFEIYFAKDKLTLKVPIEKIKAVGMRKLADEPTVKTALKTLQGKAKIRRIMWSRRAQEYDSKINSGDLIQISEVVRDLYRSETESEQSYSERQLYEAALEQMVGELAAIRKFTDTEAVHLVEANLAKRPARSARVNLATPMSAAEVEIAKKDNKKQGANATNRRTNTS